MRRCTMTNLSMVGGTSNQSFPAQATLKVWIRQGSHGVGKSGKGMEFNFDSSRPGNGLEFHVVVGKCG